MGDHVVEREQAEAQLHRRVTELSALSAMATIVNESLDVDEILGRAMDEALRLVGVEAAAMFLLDEPAGELVMVAHRGISDETVRAASRLKLGEGLTGGVAQRGEPFVMADLSEYPGMLRAYLEQDRIQSAAVVPLLGPTVVMGTMNLATASPNYFDADGLDLLVSLGRQIAIGVERARLYQETRAWADELEQRVQEQTADLAASEARYRTLFESVPVGIGLSTPDGRVLEANAAMCQITGYSLAEFQQTNLGNTYLRPEDRAGLLERLQTHGVVRDFEVQLKRRDGSLYWASLTITPFSLGGEPVFLTVAEDISERVRADEQIRYQAALLANVSDAVIATDMDFCVTSWNRAAEEMYGWRADEVLGKPLGALFQGEYPGTSREKVIAEFLERGKWRGQTVHHRNDGSAIHILGSVSALQDGAGNRVGAVSVNRDISERVRAEEQTRQRTEDLALINALNDAGNQGQSLQEIVQILIQETRRIFDCHGASVYLLSQDGQYLIMQNLTFNVIKLRKCVIASEAKQSPSTREKPFAKRKRRLLRRSQTTLAPRNDTNLMTLT